MSDFHSIAKDQLTDRIYAYFDDEELLGHACRQLERNPRH
jgi:hypothetical protein